MKKICPLCGTENEEDARFCKECNEPLYDISAEEEKRKRRKIILDNKVKKGREEFEKIKTARQRQDAAPNNVNIIKQLFGLIGSAVLFVGVFTPIVSIPLMGNLNYFQNGKGDGVIILVLAIISFILVLLKKFKGLWFTGIGSVAIMIFTFINFQIALSSSKMQIETELSGNPFRGIADMAMQSVQIQWGWALLIVGAIFVIVSAAIKDG